MIQKWLGGVERGEKNPQKTALKGDRKAHKYLMLREKKSDDSCVLSKRAEAVACLFMGTDVIVPRMQNGCS